MGILCFRILILSDDNFQVLKAARDKFTQEISFQAKDKEISLAKVILLFCPLLKVSSYNSIR